MKVVSVESPPRLVWKNGYTLHIPHVHQRLNFYLSASLYSLIQSTLMSTPSAFTNACQLGGISKFIPRMRQFTTV